MPLNVQILDNVLKRLEDVYSPVAGCLFGVMYEGKVLVVGVGFELHKPGAKRPIWYDTTQQLYPTGIDWCGVFTIELDINVQANSSVKECMKDIAVTNNPLFLRKDINTGCVNVYYSDGSHLKFCDFEIIKKSEFMEKFVYLRLVGMTYICLPLALKPRHVERAMEKISARIAAGMFFQMGSSKIYLNRYTTKYDHSSLGTIFDNLRKEKDFRNNVEVLKVSALFPQGPFVTDDNKLYKPQIYDYSYPQILDKTENEKHYKFVMNLPFDALCIAHRDREMDEVYELLIDTAERTVFLCESYLLKYMRDPLKVHNIRAHHFFPDELGHALSLVFSTEQDDENLVRIRRQVHAFLNLPLDRPYFRRANSLILIPSTYTTRPLMNVHLGVKPSGIRSDRSKSSLVQGAYYYYHYMMDGLNDSGWGCAYRSFQTIFSWFKLQGYTTMEIPTHWEIQECLVRLGDKPREFRGSKTWIGSTEVAYVLEIFVKSQSIILNVASGSEMGSLGQAIYEHFELHGIPIMIGGGVLAHTILGIDIDEENGDTKFLVLDPHYTEDDELAKIQKKGFIGWKGLDFWDSRSFYNLCLPQRPRCY
ncbi:ufm1-specific protease 2 [Halyomorpha halys]|uniref:ufm1-specific protease 2 n=1 Tax=Halyomorpha halys TaxID=286706 RepID=UPI0006D51516|nr:ufm1-specific protease 2-like [Halyomorpha halys]